MATQMAAKTSAFTGARVAAPKSGRVAVARVAQVTRAGAYDAELVETAVSFRIQTGARFVCRLNRVLTGVMCRFVSYLFGLLCGGGGGRYFVRGVEEYLTGCRTNGIFVCGGGFEGEFGLGKRRE